jgi:hypothetical protein
MIPNHKLEYIYKIIINYLFLLQNKQGYFESALINTKLFAVGIVSDNYAEKLEIILTFKKNYDDKWYFNFLYCGQNVIIENNSKNYNVSYHDAINALYTILMLWASCINKNKINKTMDFLIEVDEY